MSSSDDTNPVFTSPLAKLSAFAKNTAPLLSSFNRAQSPLPSTVTGMFSNVSFSSDRASAVAPTQPSPFDRSNRASGGAGRSVSGKSGGVDTVGVFVVDDGLHSICLGQVGALGEKFCTLPCLSGSTSCSVKSHSNKADVRRNHIFIKAPDSGRSRNAAFVSPMLNISEVDDEKLVLLQELSLSVKTWNRIFLGFENVSDAPKAKFLEYCQECGEDFKAPFTAVKKRRAAVISSPTVEFAKAALETIPLNPFIDGKFQFFTEEQDAEFRKSWSNLVKAIEILRTDVPKLDSRVKRTRVELEIAIDGVESSVELLSTDVGRDPGIDHGAPVTTVWSGIQLAIGASQEAQKLVGNLELALSQTVQDVKTQTTDTASSIGTLRNEVNLVSSHVHQVLHDLKTTVAPSLEKLIQCYNIGAGSTNQPLGDVLARLRNLESLSVGGNFAGGPPSETLNSSIFGTRETSSTPDLARSVTKLTTEIKLLNDLYSNLDDKLHSNSVQIDDFTFGSRTDTEKWVRQHVPGHEPDGFHDIMTLLQLVSDPHISFKEGMDEAYLSSKVGFNSSSSARNAHSFKCELPDVFGKITVGGDKGFPLPALKSYKIWNPNDGVSGTRRTTTQSLKFQVENIKTMMTHYYGTSKAYHLAYTMLSKSHSFWIALANWMDEFHLKLTVVSCCAADEAWLLVASCVRAVFRELRRVRICAQEAEKLPDKGVSCALFLWGNLQAHRIMDQFLIHSFEGHPVITPVINMHLFQHRVPVSVHNAQKAKVAAMEKLLGELRRDVDRLKNKKSTPAVA